MYHSLWKSVLGEIEVSIPSGIFSTWFANTEMLSNKDGVITIGVVNVFAIRQFEVRYDSIVKEALQSSGIEVSRIAYVVNKHSKNVLFLAAKRLVSQPTASRSEQQHSLASQPPPRTLVLRHQRQASMRAIPSRISSLARVMTSPTPPAKQSQIALVRSITPSSSTVALASVRHILSKRWVMKFSRVTRVKESPI